LGRAVARRGARPMDVAAWPDRTIQPSPRLSPAPADEHDKMVGTSKMH
jgi:hypothetical protein